MFGGCLILAVVSAVAGIQVSIPKPEYEVARGDNVTLPCRFEPADPNYKFMVVSWSTLSDKPGVKGTPVATYYDPSGILDVSPQFEKRISMKTDVDTKTVDLLLTRVTLLENKVFECEVKIPKDDEGTLAATTRLIVLVAPSKPVCKVEGETVYGQNIKLTCMSEEGSPTPTYTWQRYDVQNRPGAFPPKATQENGLLSLFNISMETSGYYICTSTNKIRSASCNMTLTVMPPSMNIGSTAGIIGGCVGALLLLGIIVYCCCCRKKKDENKEYAMGTMEDGAYHDEDAPKKTAEYRDNGRNEDGDGTINRSPRGRIDSDEERSERNYDRRDDYGERRERYDDRRSDYDDRRSDYDDRRSDYTDRRSDYDDRRSDYDDRRRYDDGRDRYPPRRDRYDDRRDDYDDHRDRDGDRRDRDGDRRDRESDRPDSDY